MDFEVIKRGNVIEMLESPTSEVSALDLGGRVVTALMRRWDEVQSGLSLGTFYYNAVQVESLSAGSPDDRR